MLGNAFPFPLFFLPLIQRITLICSPSLSNLTLANFLVYSGDDDDDVDDKEVENRKDQGRRKQLDGGSSLIETRNTPMYGSIPLTHGRNFFGFTFMDLSGE
jgi:hypothetical protein